MPNDSVALVTRHLLRRHATTISELEQLGVPPSTVKRLRTSGLLTSLGHGVVGLSGTNDRRSQSIAAALAMHRDSVVSHATAAHLHGLDVSWSEVHLTAPLGTRGKGRRIVVHRTDLLPPVDRGMVRNWPVTSRPRTLCDLAATTESDEHYATIVEGAIIDDWVDLDALLACHEELRERGRTGGRRRARVFDLLLAGDIVVAGSRLEGDFAVLVERHRIEGVVFQFEPPWFDGVRGVVDAAVPSARLVIELDGRRWHTARERFEDDRARDRAAAEHGWRVLRFTWGDVHRRPEMVVASIRAAISLHPPTSLR